MDQDRCRTPRLRARGDRFAWVLSGAGLIIGRQDAKIVGGLHRPTVLVDANSGVPGFRFRFVPPQLPA